MKINRRKERATGLAKTIWHIPPLSQSTVVVLNMWAPTFSVSELVSVQRPEGRDALCVARATWENLTISYHFTGPIVEPESRCTQEKFRGWNSEPGRTFSPGL